MSEKERYYDEAKRSHNTSVANEVSAFSRKNLNIYKAVLFDFDYTLGDTTEGIVLSANYALKSLGFAEKSVPEIKRTIGLSLKDTFTALTESRDEKQSERFTALFREKADEVMTDSAALYDRVPEILHELHKTRKIGIVTTKFHYRIEAILKKFGVSEFVDVIVGGEDVTREKPDPEGLLKAIEALGVRKSETLYVGDSLVDARTAANAGVDFAAVLTGTTDDFSEYDSVFVGKSVFEVYGFVIKE